VNVRLSGYGVELAIKSTEYKAKDDTVITGIILMCVGPAVHHDRYTIAPISNTSPQ